MREDPAYSLKRRLYPGVFLLGRKGSRSVQTPPARVWASGSVARADPGPRAHPTSHTCRRGRAASQPPMQTHRLASRPRGAALSNVSRKAELSWAGNLQREERGDLDPPKLHLSQWQGPSSEVELPSGWSTLWAVANYPYRQWPHTHRTYCCIKMLDWDNYSHILTSRESSVTEPKNSVFVLKEKKLTEPDSLVGGPAPQSCTQVPANMERGDCKNQIQGQSSGERAKERLTMLLNQKQVRKLKL